MRAMLSSHVAALACGLRIGSQVEESAAVNDRRPLEAN